MGHKLHRIAQRPVLLLGALFAICASLIFAHLYNLNTKLVESNTVHSAKQYAEVLTQFRTLYTSEVVEKAVKAGLVVTHDYQDKETAIPLPATLSMLLGEKMGLEGLDVRTRLYSAYPFPWRNSNGGLNDDFSKEAWDFLQKSEVMPYIKIMEIEGVPSVRYAVADIMRPKCVGCHNSHPDTPKNDWKVGDVRGVLEVIQPLTGGLVGAQQAFLKMVSLVTLMLVITLVIIYFFIRSLNDKNDQAMALNESLAHEVKERIQAEHEAVAANQTKSLFLANITHEIRTPMNAILGYTQILKSQKDLAKDQEKSLSIIEKSGVHLLGLINDVLDISKIESGALELHETEFDITDLLRGIGDMFQLKTQQKGLNWRLAMDFPNHNINVRGDEGKLRQILINLTGNAVKFTDSGFVELRVSMHNNTKFEFTIIDSGLGISAEEINKLGKPFSQGAAGNLRGGTGLGLALSKKYLALMDSELTITPNPEEGTTLYFSIALPVTRSTILFSQKEHRVKHIANDQAVNVLIIDDNPINRDIMGKMLTNIGANVDTAINGIEGLKKALDTDFDLILTDIDMPELDGYQFLEKYRSPPNLKSTPVVAISASTINRSKEYFVDRGFSDFIEKPFLMQDLFDCLHNTTGIQFEYYDSESEKTRIQEHKVKWPNEKALIDRMIAAAKIYLISDIEEDLEKLEENESEYSFFVSHVKEFLARYDMDGLVKFLEQQDEQE